MADVIMIIGVVFVFSIVLYKIISEDPESFKKVMDTFKKKTDTEKSCKNCLKKVSIEDFSISDNICDNCMIKLNKNKENAILQE